MGIEAAAVGESGEQAARFGERHARREQPQRLQAAVELVAAPFEEQFHEHVAGGERRQQPASRRLRELGAFAGPIEGRIQPAEGVDQAELLARLAEPFFDGEIVPVEVPAGRKGEKVPVARDEHPRPETTLEALAKLKGVVKPGGTVTAGNASGVNDGAVAVLVAGEAAVARYGLRPMARILSMATVGVEPRIMGIGPAPATRKVLERAGLSLARIDAIELNEAFAAQALAVLRQLGLPDDAEHVNPNGGAIALGHPLGASGARLVLTLARELERRDGRYGLATMCIGVGQGIAMVIERMR
uniref:acetyl-CoA C-acyltransferase n=1 Tax=uncultured organism TaxID=155900 RepID=M1PKE6_9ZZZZ|nr:putative beta-ketoadipyl CoA thiolase [uncultured organism]